MNEILVDILRDVGLPAVTAIGGWFVAVYRTRQKKESDILDNTKQILDMQREYIEQQRQELISNSEKMAHLDYKLNLKRKSIRRAANCAYINEGDGCPVMASEEENEQVLYPECARCKHTSRDRKHYDAEEGGHDDKD